MLVISLATEQGVLSWLLFQPLSQVQNQKGSKQTVDERPQDRAASCCSPRVPLKPHRSHLRTPPPPPHTHQRKQEGIGCRSMTPSLSHIFSSCILALVLNVSISARLPPLLIRWGSCHYKAP